MVTNKNTHLRLTEREADLFYATIEPVLDIFISISGRRHRPQAFCATKW